ncbi:transporter substrate-binding domain-containing protein [Peribacillus muralis]|uniref:transporter substrate-binding domain-containing protein n=1 Tax=Peribacillus muralis TaxID=264697 RepID=UPI001428CC71|nr:transporter substrate-binding domain-containing protein [Peribacillus muralis]
MHDYQRKEGFLIKKNLMAFLSLVCCASFGQIPWSSDVLAEQKTFIIAVETALPPFSFKNEANEMDGINIELMEEIAKNSGAVFEYVPMEIQEAEKALMNGEIDALVGSTYSIEKDNQLDFTQPYFTMSQSIIIPSNRKKDIHTLTDLRDAHVVLDHTTPVIGTFLNMRNTNLTTVSNQYSGVLTLLNGRADVFIGNKWTAEFYLKKLRKEKQYIILDEVIEPADYTIAVKQGNQTLLFMMDNALTELKANRQLNGIIDKWIMPQSDRKIARLEQFIFWLTMILTAGAIILFIIYIWNQKLKKSVHAKTRTLHLLNEDLKKQRQKLANSEAFKEQILNNIDAGIITYNHDFLITSCNEKASDILNISKEMILNISNHNEFLKMFDASYPKQGEKKGTGSLRIRALNGQHEQKVISYSMHKMFNTEKSHTGYLLSMNDETEKKTLEKRLITQEKLHALGQLVAGVAHEIRNPLTSIKTFIDLLPSKYDKPQFRQVLMEHLPNEVNRLNAIVTDLIEYARPRPPNITNCPAHELISLLAFHKVTMEKKKINFEQAIDENLIFYIDLQQIHQVILNLILNSIQAVEEKVEKIIKITINKENEKTGRISISDTGKGIKQEDQNHIFEPFYTNKDKGVGLGLTLSYRLIKENNGDIQVKSHPDCGTTFTILLPLSTTETMKEEDQYEVTCISDR